MISTRYCLRWCTYCRNNDIVSTIGTPRYGISKYPEGIIQPILNKNQPKVKSSKSFFSQVKTWKIELDEIQASYDVANLYPSIPVDGAMDGIILQSINDYDNLKTTKLVRIDILQLTELFIIECYFLRDNAIWNFFNLEPIGLSVMVSYLTVICKNLEKHSIDLALAFGIAPKTFPRYVDDSHTRFGTRTNATDLHVRYTIYMKMIRNPIFSNVKIRNIENYCCFTIYRKPAITYVQIKQYSNISPHITM